MVGGGGALGWGALTLSLFFCLDFVGATYEFMGFSDDAAYRMLAHRYWVRVVVGPVAVLALYAATGALFGLVAFGLRRLWGPARRWQIIVGTLLLHGWMFVHNLVRYPQLYDDDFYAKGGLRRAGMLWATRHFSPAGLVVIAVVVLVAIVGPPVWLFAGDTIRADRRRPEPRLTRRNLSYAGGALVLVALVELAHVVRARRHPPPTKQRNLLLIAVDSLRADRLFAPDAARRFPHLAQLAQRAVRFREDHVTVPRTFPSFVTLLTGRWPHHHGIRHMFPTAAQRRSIGLALPEVLRRAGWRTGVVSDFAGEIFSRTPVGFEQIAVPYFDMKSILQQRLELEMHPNFLPYATTRLGRALFPAIDGLSEHADPALLVDSADKFLAARDGRPFFLTVFFSTAHFPYAAPAPWYARFADPGYRGPYLYQKPPLAPPPANEADAVQIRALYDGAVAATDEAVGQLLDDLHRRGLDDNTTIVLLADHGENLYERADRGMGHGDHLHGSNTDHVPLLIVDPAFPPHDVTALVRDVDVAPTLAERLGVTLPNADGVSLMPLLTGARDNLDLDGFSETEFWFTESGPGFGPDERLPYPGITGATELADDDDIVLQQRWQDLVVVAKQRAIRHGKWKLLYRPTRAGVQLSLFDLSTDPDESHDVRAAHPDVSADLWKRLSTWMLGDAHMTLRGGYLVPK